MAQNQITMINGVDDYSLDVFLNFLKLDEDDRYKISGHVKALLLDNKYARANVRVIDIKDLRKN